METIKRKIFGSREISVMAAIAGLISGGKGRLEPNQPLQGDNYKKAFEALLLIVMAFYGFIVTSNGFDGLTDAAVFINSHWPALMLSVMCIVLGLARIQKPASQLPANSE
jgi:hypothetical protein